MTDRVHSLTITFKDNIRVDDIESLENAIRWMAPVASVRRNLSNIDEVIAEQRVYERVKDRLWDVIRDLDKRDDNGN